MATVMATGLCKGSDSSKTAREAALMAVKKLGGKEIDVVILYSSSSYDYGQVLKSVREVTGNAPLVGCSTAGEFTEDNVGTGSIAVCLMSSDDIRFHVGLAENIDKDPAENIARMVNALPSDIEAYKYKCILLLSDGLLGNGEEITILLSTLLDPDTSVVGGLAADDFKLERTVVFFNDKFTDKASSICVMASNKPFFTSVQHGHCPMTEPMMITKAEKNVLYEIENKPAWQVWKEKTAKKALEMGIDVYKIKTKQEIGQYFANFELGFKVGKNNYKVRYPMSVNSDDSINFTCTIPPGANICIMDGNDKQKQVEATGIAAKEVVTKAKEAGFNELSGAFIIECAVRQFMLGKDFYMVQERIKKELGAIPFIGVDTMGEIRLEPNDFSGFHNTTTVVLVFPK